VSRKIDGSLFVVNRLLTVSFSKGPEVRII
jgi:hypothetical protein